MGEKSPREAKKEIIIESAVKVFSQKGYHNTHMGEIAAEAGIGKATIYEYFDSKLHLFQEMLEKSMEKYDQCLSKSGTEHYSAKETIASFLEAHISFCRENKNLTRIVFWDSEILDEELKDWLYNMRIDKEKRLMELAERWIASGEIRKVDTFILNMVLSGIIGATWVPIALDGWEPDVGDLSEKLNDIIFYGIKNDRKELCNEN